MSKCLLNHEAFDIITDDAAYWIGFLFADGSVVRERKGAPMVQVRLSEVDRGHIVKLREFLGSTHAIGTSPPGNFGGYASRASVRLAVNSERLASRLLELGRYHGPIGSELATSRHFWRGVVDGDGSIFTTKTGYTGFGVVGSRRLLDAFLGFLKERNLARRMTVRPAKSIYGISTAGHLAELIIEELYRDGATALDRKAAAAGPIIELARAARAKAEADRARAEADAAELRQRYEAGATLVELGQHYGVSNVTVLYRMRRAGIPRRPPRPREKAARQAAAEDNAAHLADAG
jgi:hypothetical protein